MGKRPKGEESRPITPEERPPEEEAGPPPAVVAPMQGLASQVPIVPVPTSINLEVVNAPDGTGLVRMTIGMPSGIFVVFLKGENAKDLAGRLEEYGAKASLRAASGLLVPSGVNAPVPHNIG